MTQLIGLYYSEVAKNSHAGNSSKDTRMEWLDYALITVEISLDHVEYLLSCWDLGPEVYCIIHSFFFGASREGQLWCWSHRTVQIPVLEHNPQPWEIKLQVSYSRWCEVIREPSFSIFVSGSLGWPLSRSLLQHAATCYRLSFVVRLLAWASHSQGIENYFLTPIVCCLVHSKYTK